MMVRQHANAKLCEQPKGKVESADEWLGQRAAVQVRWNCKLGDDPDRVHRDVFAKAGGEVADFFLAEAVEEEVGRNQVVVAMDQYEGAGICQVCANTSNG